MGISGQLWAVLILHWARQTQRWAESIHHTILGLIFNKWWSSQLTSFFYFDIPRRWDFKLNSDLQAGIWFGSVAPSPIITLPPPLCFSNFCLKSRLFWTCAHVQCRVHFFHHVEFYFLLRQRIAFPVWG